MNPKIPVDLDSAMKFVERIPFSGCWIWTRESLNGGGYGVIPSKRLAHRYMYEQLVGPIESGKWVLHRCDVRACVNPDHLFIGTATDNNRDTVAKGRYRNQNTGKTHCKHGHEFTDSNIYWKGGRIRQCRICTYTKNAGYAQRNKLRVNHA